jgi:hypothetical protein
LLQSAKKSSSFLKPKDFCTPQYAPAVSANATKRAKVFWFFFSKKNCYLSLPKRRHTHGPADNQFIARLAAHPLADNPAAVAPGAPAICCESAG